MPDPSLRHGKRYVVCVIHKTDEFVCLAGPADFLRRPVYDLPPAPVASGTAETTAIWRGVFLACGSLIEPGRSSLFKITCSSPGVALAMVGCAHKLGASARSKEVRGTDHISVRDSNAISTLIFTMGAPQTFEAWRERHECHETRDSVNRLANFDDVNLRRSVRAAVAAGTHVKRAFEILGDDIPAHLLEADTLRLQYKQASLEELGRYTNPPLTRNIVAGRIRRLLILADKTAHERGIPDMESALTFSMLEES